MSLSIFLLRLIFFSMFVNLCHTSCKNVHAHVFRNTVNLMYYIVN